MVMNYMDMQACTGSLTEVGVPENQAQRFVEVMAQTFVQFSEHLVTSEHLDLRLFEHRAYMDSRFGGVDKDFADVESNFVKQRAYMDDRFARLERQLVEQRAYMDTRLGDMQNQLISAKSDTDRHLDRIDDKFSKLFFMVGLGFTVLIIPQLTAMLGS